MGTIAVGYDGSGAAEVALVGYGPLRRVLLGSTAAESIHHADYPVIVVPRGAKDSDP